eukprot:5247255-Prymnesium_polylepis.1
MSEISSLLAFLSEKYESFLNLWVASLFPSSDEAGLGSRLLRGPGGGVMGCLQSEGDGTPAAWQR